MNLAEFWINNRVITLVLTFVMLGVGLQSFQKMSRLEDPEFTIKQALVVTPYQGASATEVEKEVSDRIEKAVQEMGQLKKVTSKSERGLSTVTVEVKDHYDKTSLPQVWDELRRKINDVQSDLPPGASTSQVIDDYGDVYGNFLAVYGDGYSYAEIKDVVDLLRREFLLVKDVAKVTTYGELQEVVYVELKRTRISQLGISNDVIINELQQKNLVAQQGKVKVEKEYITITPEGGVDTVKDFENILILGTGRSQIYLKDIADIRRGYQDPASNMMRFNGNIAIGMGISTISGGNVVDMGHALKQRLLELQQNIPIGIEFGIVSWQSDTVEKAISGFVLSLIEAVVIVILVLVAFMGLQSSVIIGTVLIITIGGSFIFLLPMGVALERISLGALIIALGMLVDNAIVVVDGVLVRIQKGENVKSAAIEVVKQTALPLLGATVIAILAFAAIGTSDDNTGEFCRSLFQVVFVALLLSWVTAVTITPLMCVMMLKAPTNAQSKKDSGLIRVYKKLLTQCIHHKLTTLSVVIILFVTSLWSFQFVSQSFFPESTRPQISVDVWLPQGTHISETKKTVEKIENFVKTQEGVTNMTSLIGEGALRFLLTYDPEQPNSAYAQLLVDVESTEVMDLLINKIENHLSENFPDVNGYGAKFRLGPGGNGKIQTRISGPNPNTLRRLADEVEAIYRADHDSKGFRTDWRQIVKTLKPVISEVQANANGISRSDIANVIQENFQGRTVGVFRDGDLLLPIVLKVKGDVEQTVDAIQNLQIWSSRAQREIPLRQVISRFDVVFEDEIIQRRNRLPTITVFADPIEGGAAELFQRLRPQIEALSLPPGYFIEWGGEYEDSGDAQAGLAASIPAFAGAMILVTIMLFNSLRLPLIIWLTVPLALIGVTSGLLLSDQPFGFMALLGFLSLSGMLIKNAIVLIDEINLEINQGKRILDAIVDSGASRMRPVAMAASTTALGMIPLLFDAFFVSMAVTIIAGLIFATVLTMVVVPVLYASLFLHQENT
ncbi:MAG: efflux RND transporter permease subunit [Pseudomonadota bacterium]